MTLQRRKLRTRLRHIAWSAVCLLAILPGPAWADKKSELDQLRQRIESLQRDLAKSEESRSEAADALRVSEKAISEVNRKVVALGREQAEIGQALADIRRKTEANRSDTASQQELLDRLVRHQYMYGNNDALRLLLEGRDAAEVERQMQYFGYVSRTRAGLIGTLRRNAAELAELENANRAKQAELAENAAEQRKLRTALQSERSARQRLVTKVRADIAKGRKEIGRLKRDEERLTKLIDQLAKAVAKTREERKTERGVPPRKGEQVESVADSSAAGQTFASLKGKLKLPVRGELQGRFGSPREEGGVTWTGLLIKAKTGNPVNAVADGQVVFADWYRGYGNLLVVDHGGGYMSVYGNNESLLKQVGELVRAGETVASAGTSGGASESGVYFELRHEGKAFDPMKWVAK